jgi:hypothetical protein
VVIVALPVSLKVNDRILVAVCLLRVRLYELLESAHTGRCASSQLRGERSCAQQERNENAKQWLRNAIVKADIRDKQSAEKNDKVEAHLGPFRCRPLIFIASTAGRRASSCDPAAMHETKAAAATR